MEIRDFLGNRIPPAEAAFIAATARRSKKERLALLDDAREGHEDLNADRVDERAEAAGEEVSVSQALPSGRLAKRPRYASHRHGDPVLRTLLGDDFANSSAVIRLQDLKDGVAAIGVMAASFQTAGAPAKIPTAKSFAHASLPAPDARPIETAADNIRAQVARAESADTEGQRADELQLAGRMARSTEDNLNGYAYILQRSMPGTPIFTTRLTGNLAGTWRVMAQVRALTAGTQRELGEVHNAIGYLAQEIGQEDPRHMHAPAPV